VSFSKFKKFLASNVNNFD